MNRVKYSLSLLLLAWAIGTAPTVYASTVVNYACQCDAFSKSGLDSTGVNIAQLNANNGSYGSYQQSVLSAACDTTNGYYGSCVSYPNMGLNASRSYITAGGASCSGQAATTQASYNCNGHAWVLVNNPCGRRGCPSFQDSTVTVPNMQHGERCDGNSCTMGSGSLDFGTADCHRDLPTLYCLNGSLSFDPQTGDGHGHSVNCGKTGLICNC